MNTNTATQTTFNPSDVKAAMATVLAIAETIRELGTVPSGTLYGHLMGKFSLSQYESIIGILTRNGMVTQDNCHRLIWTGPALRH